MLRESWLNNWLQNSVMQQVHASMYQVHHPLGSYYTSIHCRVVL
jgi:hypothetical protein